MKAIGLRQAIKPLIPAPLLDAYRRARLSMNRLRYSWLSAPDAFDRIYRTNAWGGSPGEFCSGTGSQEMFTDQYCECVLASIRALSDGVSPVKVVDLGCGDFRVGAKLVGPQVDYLGIDIVQRLIDDNRARFERPGVSFARLDIIKDELPAARIALVRQVLQHLSNSEIARILPKLAAYEVVFITEHYPTDESHVVPNRDKPHGPDIRLYDNSAVYLDLPPFNVVGLETCLVVNHGADGLLKTFRITRRAR